jgi:hypothetical protein
MAKKILPGELFIVLYQDGGGVNTWAVNSGITAIELRDGHLVKAGVTDVLIESLDPDVSFTNNRGNLDNGDTRVTLLKDSGFRKQTFGSQELSVLKVLNTTDIFNSSGTKIGTVPAGTEIGIAEGTAGNSMKHLLAFNAYDSKDGNGWRFANQANYSYGFINIQKAFGLKAYNSIRAISTNFSEIKNNINWNEIQAVQEGKTALKEAYLRNVPVADTKEQVVKALRDYFASIDLSDEVLGDPTQYFSNANNAEFIIDSLIEAGNQVTADLFNDERYYFNNK